MNPDNRGTLWTALLVTLAVLWLSWVLMPGVQPVFVILVAAWLLIAAWMSTR